MQRPNALSLSGWPPLFEAAADDADRVAPGLAERTRRELDDVAERWPTGLPSGVIHADLFTDNVFFIGDAVSGLIDFYFACTDAFAYDLAICLNAWCFEPDLSFNVTKGRAMISGYQAVRALTEPEAAALPVLCRGSALRFMLTRLVDWLNVPPGALVKPKDPLEYDRKLAFHRRVASAADYGLAA
jgi:homoserine kinase type II